jgi:hypothetical protein
MPVSRHGHQRAIGERHADGLALAAVPVHREESAIGTGTRDPVTAVGAGAVAESKGRDDEVALGDALHLGTDIFHHADELMADRSWLELGLAAVVPEVRTADTGERDADHGVGRLRDGRVGSILDFYRAWSFKESCAHPVPPVGDSFSVLPCAR